jgi:hypothetical protein
MSHYSHYDYLDENLPTFFKKIGILYKEGIISAYGDKAYSYRDKWQKGGLHFYHGVAIYILTYVRPFSKESRETINGWVDPGDWVLANKDRFIQYLPKVKSL